jgi:mannose-6-phosphate isomerase
VVVALLLNHVTLAPGEAIWMPAGNLHAYLRGCGVEIMAASDNVLRGGLTRKHVDVPELLRVLRYEVLADPVLAPVRVADGVVTWPVPVADFALHGVRLDDGVRLARLALPGPRVVLCVDGEVEADDGRGAVRIRSGQAAVGAAEAGPLTLTGSGEAYVASVGLGAPQPDGPASAGQRSATAGVE